MQQTGIYHSWTSMKARCDNPNNPKFYRYGKRGVTYTPAWKEFMNFYNDMSSSHIEGLTLDRTDVNKGYTKENCQWITRGENSSKDKLKPLCKYDLAGIFLTQYSSAKEACASEEGITKQSLSRVTKNGKPYKGFRWKFSVTTDNLSTNEMLVSKCKKNRLATDVPPVITWGPKKTVCRLD
jgi:hypothetical protein